MRSFDHNTGSDTSGKAERKTAATATSKTASTADRKTVSTADRKTASTADSKTASTADSKTAGTADRKTAATAVRKTGRGHKFLYRLLGVVILLSVILAAEYMASVSFRDVQLKDYYNVDIRRLDEENKQVDMIITGASQVYHGCNPDVFSEEMGIGEVIDCSSSAATNDGLYYMLQGLLDRFDPQYVVITLAWDAFIPKEDVNYLKGQLLAADRMPMTDRVAYYLTCIDPSEWMNLSIMYRYGGIVWGFSQLIQNYKARMEIESGNWVDASKRIYQKNGYCRYGRKCHSGSITAGKNVYSPELVNEHEYDYIRKSIDLCKEKGVNVFLVTAPTSMADLYGVENYQESADYMEAFAQEMGCEYYNFNLFRNREEIFPDSSYSDYRHLNKYGAEVYSRTLADILKKSMNGEDVSSLFYEDYEELRKDVHRIVGCGADVEYQDDNTVQVAAYSFRNEDVMPEYRLLLAGEDGSTSELRAWQEDSKFLLDESELLPDQGLRLEVRKKGEEAAEAYQDNILEEVADEDDE